MCRYDGKRLSVELLTGEEDYSKSRHSRCFPRLSMIEIARFLAASSSTDETTWIGNFRAGVRENLLPDVG